MRNPQIKESKRLWTFHIGSFSITHENGTMVRMKVRQMHNISVRKAIQPALINKTLIYPLLKISSLLSESRPLKSNLYTPLCWIQFENILQGFDPAGAPSLLSSILHQEFKSPPKHHGFNPTKLPSLLKEGCG